MIEDRCRFINLRNFHIFDFLTVFEQSSDFRCLLLQKIEFLLRNGSVLTIVQDLENELFRNKSLVDFLLGLDWCRGLGLGCLLFLLLANWWRGSILDQKIFEVVFVVSDCEIDRCLASLVLVVHIDAMLQQVLNYVQVVLFYCVV